MLEKLFEDYSGLRKECEQLRDMIETEKRIYYPRTPRLTGLPGAHNNADISAGVIRYIEKVERYNAKMAELAVMIDLVEDAISKLDDPEERVVMRMFYIQGKTIKAIAKKEHWSISTCNRRKRNALNKLGKI